jgi:[ribosomal protein S18]-alanine N-acetyltransferase
MPLTGLVIRSGTPADLGRILAIQTACPHAAQWNVVEYIQYDLRVATYGALLTGFLAARTLALGEWEILNLAISPEFRRQGVGHALLEHYLKDVHGDVFLEVRSSNYPAREFYKSVGFEELTVRSEYYKAPVEAAIVMKFHSC